MRLWTDAIQADGHLDPRYTCDTDNSSPELRWRDPPEGTLGYAVIAEDLDASGDQGPYAHWVVYNLPATILHLPAGIPAQETLPNGIKQGLNGLGKLGYGGPCPPETGQAHRYAYRVYALRIIPDIPSRATRAQVIQAIEPFVISTAEVVGLYGHGEQAAVDLLGRRTG